MDRCLLCDKELSYKANLYELMFIEDIICFNCRNSWIKNNKKYFIKGFKVDSTYIYEENFSKALLQYKECFDEALYNIFLYRHIEIFKIKYYGYTLIPMPSSKEALEKRGFNHLIKIFKDTNLNIEDVLYKSEDIKQMNQDLKERSNIKNVIKIKDITLPKKVVLVDDVCTTGSTLSSAIDLIKPKVKKLKIYTISTNHKNVI
ncbi:MAG: ComF family protein [Erysipelotrichaceae bacterium]|nr:ComF family protein [Erysipelotrichaceae bacterium]